MKSSPSPPMIGVVALLARQGVVAGAAVEQVVARPPYMAGSAPKAVVAVLAVEFVVPAAAGQVVAAGAAVHHVVADELSSSCMKSTRRRRSTRRRPPRRPARRPPAPPCISSSPSPLRRCRSRRARQDLVGAGGAGDLVAHSVPSHAAPPVHMMMSGRQRHPPAAPVRQPDTANPGTTLAGHVHPSLSHGSRGLLATAAAGARLATRPRPAGSSNRSWSRYRRARRPMRRPPLLADPAAFVGWRRSSGRRPRCSQVSSTMTSLSLAKTSSSPAAVDRVLAARRLVGRRVDVVVALAAVRCRCPARRLHPVVAGAAV